MDDKFQKKYRIPSARWKTWNYSWDGLYFITICTADRECLFGNIVNKELHLSEMGDIMKEEWLKSFHIRQELYCEAFVIMPNHIHAILRIDNKMNVDRETDVVVETHGRASLRRTTGNIGNTGIAFREPKSVSSFVAGMKSAATSRINQLRQTKGKPVWQSRFHDHVIRDYDEQQRIEFYIDTNVETWNDDMFYVQ